MPISASDPVSVAPVGTTAIKAENCGRDEEFHSLRVVMYDLSRQDNWSGKLLVS